MTVQIENTKDRFLYHALKLFGERGYGSVTVAQIAKEVGCTAPALYKHYSGKRELFEAILKKNVLGRSDLFSSRELTDQEKAIYISFPEEEQIKALKDTFLYVVTDEWVVAFRKFMLMEQHHMPELATMYNEHYIDLQCDKFEAIYKMMMEEGFMIPGDARARASMMIAPLLELIGICDRDASRVSWALECIDAHVREFNALTRIR